MASLKKTYWFHAVIWLGIVYGSIPLVRPICETLKQQTPFNLIVNVIVMGCIVVFINYLRKHVKIDGQIGVLLFVAVCIYSVGLYYVKIPEERIHFIQYGVLGALIVRAIRLDVRTPKAFMWAFLITTLLGWLDEGIQYITPGRYYSTSDVILNTFSAAMGIYLFYIYGRALKK